MKLYKPKGNGNAYLVSGEFFPETGAIIDEALPFYARQIADGDLIEADNSKNSDANYGKQKTKRKG